MTSTPLNEEALKAGLHAGGYAYATGGDQNDVSLAAISAYLEAVPADTVNSMPGIYDLGAPEPEGVDQVVECDEHGNPVECGDHEANAWSKTLDGTRWKGYKDGKEYRDWADLVRRYGPVIDIRMVPGPVVEDA